MPPALRVLHIVPGLLIGGAERMLEDVIAGVGAQDATHTVLNLQAGGPMQKALEAAGAEVVSAHLGRRVQSLRALPALRHTLGQLAPDVVHGWMYAGNLAALAVQHMLSTKPALIWGMHSVAPFWPGMGARRRSTSWLNRALSARPHALVYVADASARAHAQAGFAADHVHVIAGGVDTARFAPKLAARAALRERLGLPAEARIIGMVARYHPMKAHDVLVRAAAHLLDGQNEGSPCHVLLVGAGFELPPDALMRRVSPQLRARLHCLGAQSDTAPIMQGLDVCTLSSVQEALPKVLLEAMAAGVLCVATDVGDIGPLLAQTGWITTPGSPKALAEGWQKALDCPPDEAQRRRALGRCRIVAQYSQRRFASAMTALYQGLAQQKQR